LALAAALAVVGGAWAARSRSVPIAAVAGLGVAALLATAGHADRDERRRWREPTRRLADQIAALADGHGPFVPPDSPGLGAIVEALDRLLLTRAAGRAAEVPAGDDSWLNAWESSSRLAIPAAAMTRSGLYESPPTAARAAAPETPAEVPAAPPALEMISRLDPEGLRWLDSSPAEQAFLGLTLAELRGRSFLDVVHPDDRELARDQLSNALNKGEAHGLIYRVRTARGETRAVEMNVSIRFAPDTAAKHLRCHITDVTARLRASRDLRRRTRDLLRANDRLRQANRELSELRDRYRDLYQNAPAMYFSLDARGHFLDCNETMLRALGFRRDDLIGRPYATLLPEPRRAGLRERLDDYLRDGFLEVGHRWVKADGAEIDVWVTATAVRGPEGQLQDSRGVAHDVTARRALEAELREKNDRLARAVDELSRKNKELDEFTYVVSHDLQEPLRTLMAFSDFLLADHGATLGEQGREQLQYLVDASRRMRALIRELLSLSRAGRVTGEFAPVDLGALVEQVRTDFAGLARDRGGEVHVLGPLPTAWGDRDRLGQLVGNLVSNALKYHGADGPPPVVEVGVVDDPASPDLTLFVRDNGIGIDPMFHAKIFQMFRRLHTREQFEGTGAGLAICQKIAQAHGGRIWLDSAPGRGSTFYVGLPRPPAGAQHPPRTELLHAP
jgi:PAS domain S-box-containing protein